MNAGRPQRKADITGAVAALHQATNIPSLDDIRETFEFLEDWEDRYRYVIELGKHLQTMPVELRLDEALVRGCQSQVWLHTLYNADANQLNLLIDSDAHIVRGLAAIVLAQLNDCSPRQIVDADPEALFEELGLIAHLSPSRGNGLRAMIARIKQIAEVQDASTR